MELQERKALVRGYLGQTVDIEIDRPIGYIHQKKTYTLVYPINYGYVPGVLGGDGEELDVYLMGVTEPVSSYRGQIIGIVHRENDVEDKLILSVDGKIYTAEQMLRAVSFQEQYYRTTVEAMDGTTAEMLKKE